ncbi:hypothetical protein [uncultured Oxalicibacterium sp.]|uniref:hypothetical protein n=1 Tax=uncultured Oxalicibacterium sp. TaxID=1168540 RepID=UPI0025CC6270|nr:hypothetical protein [uncultured Oxalicibacterium sp.]
MPYLNILYLALAALLLVLFGIACLATAGYISWPFARRAADPTTSINFHLPEYSVIDDTINVLRLLRDRLRDEQRHSVEPALYTPRLLVLAEAIDELESMRMP